MSKRKLYECPYAKYGCTKEFKQDGMNDENLDRHVKICLYGRPEKKKITSYFQKSGCNDGASCSSSSGSGNAGIATVDEDDVMILEETNVTDTDIPGRIVDNDNDVRALDSNAAESSSFIAESANGGDISEGNDLSLGGLCRGFQIEMASGSVLSRYPFHRHDSDTQDASTIISYEIKLIHNKCGTTLVAHAPSCDRSLSTSAIDEVNKQCADIQFSSAARKLFEIGESDRPHEKMKIDMLSFDQLKQKHRETVTKLRQEKLDTLNLVRKNQTLTKQVTLNNRFRELITGADIPRLGMLLQICHKSGMGLQSIIGRLGDAIRQKYRSRKYKEKEWEIATLVLRIGGPKLLHVLHKTHGLPAPDSTRRHSNKGHEFIAATDITFEERIKTNMADNRYETSSIRTLKMDEIATESRIRWSKNDNKFLGLCYQHSHDLNMTFDTIDDAYAIRDEISAGRIHRTKEALVVGCGEVGNGGKVNSILALPSCKADSDQFQLMMNAAENLIEPDITATDGDATRRKIFCGKDKLIENKDVKALLVKLPLFDLHIIGGKSALYFDDKHNSKRLRGAIISDSRGCLIDGNIISQSQLKHVFDQAGITSYKDVLSPKDRQNVPAVLKLVEKVKESLSKTEQSDDQICKELRSSMRLLIHIFDGILCVFSQPEVNLKDQLRKLSILSHILYHQYKQYGTKFIPGQLYHDLQRMVQGSYYATALLKVKGGGKMYLYQLGTDQMEKVFNTVRTITHARNCDILELCQRLLHGEEINEIISKYPELKRFHGKRLNSYHDASSQRDWSGNLEVNDVDCCQQWIFGRAKACELLNEDVSYFATTTGYSMLRPNKRLVGVTVDIERAELCEAEVNTRVQESEEDSISESEILEEDDNIVSLDIEEFIEDNEATFEATVEVGGKIVHKASAVREIFNENFDGSSTDRLRRVRSYSKYVTAEEFDSTDNEVELDEMVMTGDKVCGKVALKSGTACFAIGKIASIKDITSKKFKTCSPIAKLHELQFQVKIAKARITGDTLHVHHEWSSSLLTWNGSHCVLLDIPDQMLEASKALYLMQSLPLAESQKVDHVYLPYHSSLEVSLDSDEVGDKVPCRICDQMLPKKLMRRHVGVHILQEDLGLVCGFCGLKDCSIELERGSGRGKTATMVPGSNCGYISKFSLKSAEKSTKSGPCTNRPVTCEQCKTVQWSYNLPNHFRSKHSDYPVPKRIADGEEKLMGIKK